MYPLDFLPALLSSLPQIRTLLSLGLLPPSCITPSSPPLLALLHFPCSHPPTVSPSFPLSDCLTLVWKCSRPLGLPPLDARGRHSAAGGAPIGRAGGGCGADYKRWSRRRRAERLRLDRVGGGHLAGTWSPRAGVRVPEQRLPALDSALLVSRDAPLGARPLAAVARAAPRAPRRPCTCRAPRAPSGRRDERGERRCRPPTPHPRPPLRASLRRGSRGPGPGEPGRARQPGAAETSGGAPLPLPGSSHLGRWEATGRRRLQAPHCAGSFFFAGEGGTGIGCEVGLRSQAISRLLGIPPSASVLPLRGHSGFPSVPGPRRETLACMVLLRGLCCSCTA